MVVVVVVVVLVVVLHVLFSKLLTTENKPMIDAKSSSLYHMFDLFKN